MIRCLTFNTQRREAEAPPRVWRQLMLQILREKGIKILSIKYETKKYIYMNRSVGSMITVIFCLASKGTRNVSEQLVSMLIWRMNPFSLPHAASHTRC